MTGPISEVVGRNPVYITSMSFFMLFTMGSGLTTRPAPQFICRFFAGIFGSAPSVAAAGSLTDLWSRIERVYAFPFFIICSFLGATVAPTPSAFILEKQTHVDWTWVIWMTLILCGILVTLCLLFQPETYSPVLLHWKAKHLRRLTGDERYRSAVEVRKIAFWRRVLHSFGRPFALFATEPIILVISLYIGVLFATIYAFFGGYQSIYNKTYHFKEGLIGTAFLGISVGVVSVFCFVPLLVKLVRKEAIRAKEKGLTRPEPEVGLYLSMFGAPWIPISLFWMGWTARPSISYWSPIAASVLFGYGITCVFISSYEYIADTFELHSASALACVTLVRFIFAGVLAEVSYPLYHSLGHAITLTILGAVSLVMAPIPYILYRYGHRIRKWSRRAPA